MDTRKLLRAQQICIKENHIDQLKKSIDLKVWIMSAFIVIAFSYFVFEIIINGLKPVVQFIA